MLVFCIEFRINSINILVGYAQTAAVVQQKTTQNHTSTARPAQTSRKPHRTTQVLGQSTCFASFGHVSVPALGTRFQQWLKGTLDALARQVVAKEVEELTRT